MSKLEWFFTGVFVGFLGPHVIVLLTKVVKEVKMLPHEWRNPNHTRREKDEHAP